MKLSAVAAAHVAAWTSLLPLVRGMPTVSFPINAQLPPVARIAQPFSFVFADNTFTSSSSMTYSLDNSPDWLAVDSSQRWLHGTPQEADVPAGDIVGIPVSLVATDSDGSTSLNVTLVVARTTAPTVKIPIGEQLANSGHAYSEPSSLLTYASTPFTLTFSQSSFSSSGLNYYAVSGDNSPLPSWISFDAGNIAFTGTTPPADSLVEPPQTFNFQLVASDVTGFAAASLAFSIVVGSHTVTVDDPSIVLNATVGTALNYTGLQNSVKVDGRVAGPSNLTATVLSGQSPPDWLSFDTSTWLLSGTPPSSAQNTAFSISFSDALADSVNVTFQVDLNENGTVFRGMLPAMQAERGGQFSLDLEPYLLQTSGIDVTVQTEPYADWVHYDNKSRTVSGTVPIIELASAISVSVQAMHESSHTTESQTFLLQIVSRSNSTGGNIPASSATSSAGAAPASSTAVAAATGNTSKTSTRTILLAVLIPTLLLALIVSIVACCMCCRRARQKKQQQEQRRKTDDISHPVPLSFAYNGQNNAVASMRALDKEYKVGNLKDAYAKPQQNGQPQPTSRLQEKLDQLPVGTAVTTSAAAVRPEDNGEEGAATATSVAAVAAAAASGKNRQSLRVVDPSSPGVCSSIGSIPDFPPPPVLVVHKQSSSSTSAASMASATGSSHEQRNTDADVGSSVGGGSAGGSRAQWPFEESTLLSDAHSAQSRHGSDLDRSIDHGSHVSQTGSDIGDALGIYSINSGEGTGGLSGLDVDRPILSQRAIVEEFGGSVESGTAASLATAAAEAEPATMADAAGSGEGNARYDEVQTANPPSSWSGRGGSQTSVVADADGSWATLYSNGNANGAVTNHDVEKAMPSATANGESPADGAQTQTARSGFLSGFAARIADRFWKGKKQPQLSASPGVTSAADATRTVEGTRGYPSPDAMSFDTDLGSVRFDSVTTAQPYRPKPVFIGRVNRISEEPSQSGSRPSSNNNNSSGDSTSDGGSCQIRRVDPKTAKELRLQAYYQTSEGDEVSSDENSDSGGDDDDDDDDSDSGSGERRTASRVHPPKPVLFLQPSRAERDAMSLNSSLSHEIASTLGSRHRSRQLVQQQQQQQQQQWQGQGQGRPMSAMSGVSGISAAMEEVRSLLLLPATASAASMSPSQEDDMQQQQRGKSAAAAHSNGQQSTSSWETMETQSSNEPNWKSLCHFVLPPAGLNVPPRVPQRPMGTTPWQPLPTQAQAAAAAAAAAQPVQATQVAQPVQPVQPTTPRVRGIEHPVQAAFVFPMRTQPPTGAGQGQRGAEMDGAGAGAEDDEDEYEDAYDEDEDDYDEEEGEELILSDRYRPASSYYNDAFDHQVLFGGMLPHNIGNGGMSGSNSNNADSTNSTDNSASFHREDEHDGVAYPPPFVVDSSDSGGSVHRYGGPDDDSCDNGGGSGGLGGSASRGGGLGVSDRPSAIGLAVSKYSQPQLMGTTQASLVSQASSGGIKVFI